MWKTVVIFSVMEQVEVSWQLAVTYVKGSHESGILTLKIIGESGKLSTIGCHFPPKSATSWTLLIVNHRRLSAHRQGACVPGCGRGPGLSVLGVCRQTTDATVSGGESHQTPADHRTAAGQDTRPAAGTSHHEGTDWDISP